MLRSKFFFNEKHKGSGKSLASILLAAELKHIGESDTGTGNYHGKNQQEILKIVRYSNQQRLKRIRKKIRDQISWYEEEIGKWGYLMLRSEIDHRLDLIEQLGFLADKYFQK